MRQKYSAHPPKHSKSQKPASKDRQPKAANMQNQLRSHYDQHRPDLTNSSLQELSYAALGGPAMMTSNSNSNVAPYYGQSSNTKIIQDARRAIQGSIYGQRLGGR